MSELPNKSSKNLTPEHELVSGLRDLHDCLDADTNGCSVYSRAADAIERLVKERTQFAQRLADCEISLGAFDAGATSEYWLKYAPGAMHTSGHETSADAEQMEVAHDCMETMATAICEAVDLLESARPADHLEAATDEDWYAQREEWFKRNRLSESGQNGTAKP